MSIKYKHRPVRPEGQTGKGAASRVVTLVVQVHRASGLKAAARYIFTLTCGKVFSQIFLVDRIYQARGSKWSLCI